MGELGARECALAHFGSPSSHWLYGWCWNCTCVQKNAQPQLWAVEQCFTALGNMRQCCHDCMAMTDWATAETQGEVNLSHWGRPTQWVPCTSSGPTHTKVPFLKRVCVTASRSGMQAWLCGYMRKVDHHPMSTGKCAVKAAFRIASAYQFYFWLHLYFLPEPLLQKIWRKNKGIKAILTSCYPSYIMFEKNKRCLRRS